MSNINELFLGAIYGFLFILSLAGTAAAYVWRDKLNKAFVYFIYVSTGLLSTLFMFMSKAHVIKFFAKFSGMVE